MNSHDHTSTTPCIRPLLLDNLGQINSNSMLKVIGERNDNTKEACTRFTEKPLTKETNFKEISIITLANLAETFNWENQHQRYFYFLF